MSIRALLVGINRYQKLPLRGCVNDVALMQALLREQYGVEDGQMRVLLDEAATLQGLTEGLRWLAETDPADSSTPPVRLFHFSGHGLQIADTTGTEPDGKTEALAPLDYQTAGALTDDALRAIYDQVDPATHLLLLMDCCHAGDIHFAPEADIVYRFLDPDEDEAVRIREAAWNYQMRRTEQLQQIEADLRGRGVAGPELRAAIQQAEADFDRQAATRATADTAILLAAARADQLAADARFAQNYYGALSYHLNQILRATQGAITYPDLIARLRETLLSERFSQIPQLVGAAARLNNLFLLGTAPRITPGRSQSMPILPDDPMPATPDNAPSRSDDDPLGSPAQQVPPAPFAAWDVARPAEMASELSGTPEPAMLSAATLPGEAASRGVSDPTAAGSEGDAPTDELWDETQEAEYVADVPADFLDGILPQADDEDVGNTERHRGQFLYIGKGLTAEQFTAYVREYNFGTQPPSFVVLHHTAIPDTQHARARSGSWDAGEAGMSAEAIYTKRLGQLTAMKNYYQNQLGWNVGPHLFIDDRYIWLFTPMYYQGIHAAEGNGDGRGTYSIGIEVVGDYTHVRWPEPVERLVGHAVAVLKERLGSFDYVQRVGRGGISSHRDYNKPSCPGNAITNEYYMDVLKREWNRLQASKVPVANVPLNTQMPLIGPASGTLQQVVDYVQARLPGQSEYRKDVATIFGLYWKYAPTVGIDPFLAACQCVFETDALRSKWSARPHRNPAGLGVRQEGGLSFASWEDSVQAHLGQLLALALRDDEANDAQRAMMQRNPRHAHIPAAVRGTAKTIAGLDNNWNGAPGYAEALLVRMGKIRG